ncbi:hypothetical protein JTB14_002238 [Gonioctena quinquepunctata]|nr:hypothetical protein JTB14_002238 [Gonioctena quinquepunctata]
MSDEQKLYFSVLKIEFTLAPDLPRATIFPWTTIPAPKYSGRHSALRLEQGLGYSSVDRQKTLKDQQTRKRRSSSNANLPSGAPPRGCSPNSASARSTHGAANNGHRSGIFRVTRFWKTSCLDRSRLH